MKTTKTSSEEFSAIMERIKDATGARTQVELATVLDIRQSSISDAKRRNSIPADWYVKLFRKYGLNPDWLSEGKGPHYLKTKEGYQTYDEPILSRTIREERSSYGEAAASGKVVSFYSMAGGSSENGKWSPEAAGKICIPMIFDRPSLVVIKMDGTSMSPIVNRGAYIGLDRDQTNILSGEMYGILVPYEGLVVRNIYLEAEKGNIVLRSESENIGDQSFPFNEYSERLIGRVVWVMQEI